MLIAQVFFFLSAFSAEIALTEPKSTLAVTWIEGTPPVPLLLLLLLLLKYLVPMLVWWHEEHTPGREGPFFPELLPDILVIFLAFPSKK